MTFPSQSIDSTAIRFDAAAKLHPEHLALSGPLGALTYGELRDRAARLAAGLNSRGIGPGDLVAVAMKPSTALITTLVAINRCGAAYLPLDVTHPHERLRATLLDASPRLLVTDDADALRAPAGLEAAAQGALPSHSPIAPIVGSPDDPAYVIFTSGSTGQPKGVVITQRNLARLFTATDELFDFGAEDCWSLFHSIAFDVSVWEMWGALLHGSRLVIVPRDVARTADRFHALALRESVTILSQTPSAFRAFDMADEVAGRPDSALRYVVFAGERLDPCSLMPWIQAHGSSQPQLINMYGITETAVHVTFRRVERTDARGRGASLIGSPMPDMRIELLDDDGAPVPDGTTGEIWVVGAGVGAGYLNQPELTSERFQTDARTGERRYRSGDLARRTASGDLEYLGRNDDQVQLRGFRIELGEIEAALRTLPGVRDAAASLLPSPDGGGRLVAHVVLEEDATLDPHALRAQLATHLPSYMLPSAFGAIHALPRNANDKLDRGALPTIERAPVRTDAPHPNGSIGQEIEQVFIDVLGPGNRSPSDALIWLGGDSIDAMRIAQLCSQRLGVSLRVADVLEIGSMTHVEALVRAQPNQPLVPTVDRSSPLPLSPQQRALWLELAIQGAPAAYNECLALHVEARLDSERLREALDRVAERHDALRSRIVEQDGLPYWCFDGETRAADLSVCERPERDTPRLRRVADTPFDLDHGPLWRLELQLHEHSSTLLLVAHHLIFDVDAAAVMLRSISRAYDEPERGLPPGEWDISEIVAQETRLLATTRSDLERFWTHELSAVERMDVELPPPLELVKSAEADDAVVATRHLDLDAAQQFNELARQHGATPFHAYLTAAVALLRHISGQDDIVLATPASLRDGPFRDGVVGYLLAPTLIRVALKRSSTFGHLLEEVAETWRRVHRNARLPLDEVLGTLTSRSDGGRPNVYFAYHHGTPRDLRIGNAATREIQLAPPAAKFPLFIELRRDADGVLLRIEARRGDLGTTLPETLAQALAVLIRCAVHAPHTTVSELCALAFRASLPPTAWERDPEGTSSPATITSAFHMIAASHKDAVALVDGELALTYGELEERARLLSAVLRSKGVRAGDRVPLVLPRGLTQITWMLAVLEVGAVYVPLDPRSPPRRSRRMLDGLGCAIGILDSETLPPDESMRWLPPCPEMLPSSSGPTASRQASDAAYIMFTSGTTGHPKAVEVPHRAVVRLVRGQKFCRMGPEVTWLHMAPTSFDASTLEVWAPLLNGGRCIVLPDGVPEPTILSATIEEHSVTSAWFAASLFNALIDEAPDCLQGLSQILTGGEALSPSHMRRALELLPNIRLINGYGPTENTTFTCTHRIEARDVLAGRSVPIGRPIAGTTAYVLDQHGNRVPVGVPGELLTGGDGVALGYANDPGLTAERFVTDPFADAGNATMYHTGDRVRWRPEGVLEFLGRLDDQVKIRGHRIEPSEVAAVLQEHKSVAQAVVFVRGLGSETAHLVAVVVPKQAKTGPSTEESLRRFSEATLPPYLRPSQFAIVDEIPVTRAGKVDQGALELHTDLTARSTAPVRNELEVAIAQLFSDLLGAQVEDRTAHFFALGGHSLLALQLSIRIQRKFGVHIRLSDLLANPTVEGVARTVARALEEDSPRPPIQHQPRDGPIPLSPQQRALWLDLKMHGHGSAYHVPLAIDIEGELQETRLRETLHLLFDRHEALRCRLIEIHGTPRLTFDVGWDSELLEVVDSQRRAENTEPEFVRREFRLSDGPLWRAQLCRRGGGACTLLLVFHHIIFDAASAQILLEDLAQTYNDPGAPGPLPEYDLADLCMDERSRMEAGRTQLEEFWARRLGDLHSLTPDLPPPRAPDSTSRHGSAVRASIMLPAEVADAVRRSARGWGVSPFNVFVAAFFTLLRRYAGEDTVVIGTPVSLRDQPEFQQVLGYALGVVAFDFTVDTGESFQDMVLRTANEWREVHAHARLPLDLALRAAFGGRATASAPPGVFFTYRSSLQCPSLGSAPSRVRDVDLPDAKFRLLLDVVDDPDGTMIHVEAHREEVDASLVGSILRQYEAILCAALERPNELLKDLGPLAAASGDALPARSWERGPALNSKPSTVSSLFTEIAMDREDAVAVVDGKIAVTYRELQERARRHSAALLAAGVRSGDRVPLLLPRGLSQIAWMLAVLELGAVYIPLDPSDPAERLQRMLDGLGCKTGVLATGAQDPQEAIQWLAPDVEGPPRSLGQVVSRAPADPAYIMFTSGSTGHPKAVVVPHRAIVRLTRDQTFCRMDPDVAWLHMAPPSFDASTLEVWAPLLNGGRCIVLPGSAPEPEVLRTAIEQHGISSAWITASLFNVLIDEAPDCLKGLSQILTGGEALSPAHVKRALEFLPDTELINGYGPTENTTFTCTHRIEAGDVFAGRSIPIGRPIAGSTAYVLDQRGNRVPVGVPGELVTGGAGVALGYANDPQLTAERFVSDPFADAPGAMMYRTGDRVRWHPEGVIEFLGRFDDQVKIRGHRIEPSEIAAVLEKHSNVSQAVLLVDGRGTGAERLVAFVVSNDPRTSSRLGGELRELVESVLPIYLRPSGMVIVDEIPLTRAGKTDRNALLRLDESESTRIRVGRTARAGAETAVLKIWSDCFAKPGAGVEDDFFESGGHSLLGIQLLARIEEHFGQRIPPAVLFTSPTPAGIARLLTSGARPDNRPEVVPVRPVSGGITLLCLPALGGRMLTYHELTKRLPSDLNVIGLQPLELDVYDGALEDLSSMAQALIEGIHASVERGPKVLLGYSLGGYLAFEMARQLEEQGDPAALVCIVDSYAPGSISTMPLWQRILMHLQELVRRSPRDAFAHVAGRVRRRREKRRETKSPSPEESTPADAAVRLRIPEREIERRFLAALHGFKPAAIETPLVFFRASRMIGYLQNDPNDRTGGWKRWARGGVREVAINCDHGDFLREPYLTRFADALAAEIEAAVREK